MQPVEEGSSYTEGSLFFLRLIKQIISGAPDTVRDRIIGRIGQTRCG
jgi:hypothetical protein